MFCCALALAFANAIGPGTICAADAKPGEQVAQATKVTVERDGKPAEVEMRYLLYLPVDYGKSDEKVPLLLFLHGSGERGADLEVVKKHGPPKLVSEGKNFPFVLVSPQCPADSRWNADELAKLVEHVANTLRVDHKRLYVTGLSMGGSGTWSLLAAHPDLFAAAMPICGRGDMAALDQYAKTPIWAVVGGKDRAETVASMRDITAALEKAGAEGKFTLKPEAGHDVWTETYANPEVYTWLLKHKR
jgi:predicted peptidase